VGPSRVVIDQGRRQSFARLVAAALLAASLAGCSVNSDSMDTVGLLLADPLKYELYNCRQLAVVMDAQNKREREVRELIVKAERDPGGAIVAALAYKNEYARVRGEIKVLKDTMERRDCSRDTEHSGIAAVH